MRKSCAASNSLTRPHPTVPRGKTGQDVWSWVWMQWMTIASLVPCHALRVPQHVAVSLSVPLNQMISSAPSTEMFSLCIGFILE